MSSSKLIIFTRYPIPGKTKTRLIPALGAERAAAIQRQMTERMVSHADRLVPLVRDLDTEIWFSDGSLTDMQNWLGPKRTYVPQPEGDLGQRMSEALHSSLAAGHSRVVLTGIDSPGLTEHVLASAFSELTTNALVLGPTSDGGYYLVGETSHHPELFSDILWGTETVFTETLSRAKKSGVSFSSLCELGDVDTPADLALLEAPAAEERISVIIPALNEERTVAEAIESARAPQVEEVIVVDGGSGDATVRVAAGCGAKVVECGGGRAGQMNAGSRLAKNAILLFLHADTRLPANFAEQILAALRSGADCGAFRLRIDSSAPKFRILEALITFRSLALKMPYGDQALFVRKGFFHALQGYRDMPIMEDYDFVQRARKRGSLSIAPGSVATSARRWENLGVFKTTLINQRIIFAYNLGVDPAKLADIYAHAKGVSDDKP